MKLFHASKLLANQVSWDFKKTENPSFSLVTIHPAFVYGRNPLQTIAEELSGTNGVFFLTVTGGKPLAAITAIYINDVAEGYVKAWLIISWTGRCTCSLGGRPFGRTCISLKDIPVVTVLQPEADVQALGASKEPKVEVHAVMGLGSAPNLRYLSEPLFVYLGGEDGWVATGEYVPNCVVVVECGLEKIDEALNKNWAGASGEKVVLRL
ncbi:hypothetical protein DTO002I6_4621 [Penicillium roqueforti]|nr:hypothetical protein DTO002I6_4621 [Penicillium roqueforti]